MGRTGSPKVQISYDGDFRGYVDKGGEVIELVRGTSGSQRNTRVIREEVTGVREGRGRVEERWSQDWRGSGRTEKERDRR